MSAWLAQAADVVLTLAALPPAAAGSYLGLLTIASGRRRTAPRGGGTPLVEVIVPAHDEEAGVADTVRSLLAMDYPRSCFGVLVVADNCSDRTAQVAAAAGAAVLLRRDPERRGKGHALRCAFDHVLTRPEVEAVVVVDADTVVSPNLLRAVAARLAAGVEAMQAHYAVRNVEDSWRTRLLAIAFGAIHGVRSRGRQRLGLSCGLGGNGMAFSTRLLRTVPHDACSIVEDLEFAVRLAQAGRRIHYVEDAEVLGQMAASEAASRSQRRRWEGGRREIARRHAWPLLRRALRERSLRLADVAIDLLIPPLGTVALTAVLGLAACGALWAAGAPARVAPWLFGAALAGLIGYVARAVALSRVGARGLCALALAPVYVAWKVGLRFIPTRHDSGEWVRTSRAGEERTR